MAPLFRDVATNQLMEKVLNERMVNEQVVNLESAPGRHEFSRADSRNRGSLAAALWADTISREPLKKDTIPDAKCAPAFPLASDCWQLLHRAPLGAAPLNHSRTSSLLPVWRKGGTGIPPQDASASVCSLAGQAQRETLSGWL